MTLVYIVLAIVLLILLVNTCKIHPFPAFLIVSVFAALLLGLSIDRIPGAIEKGMGDILSSLLILITFGAMFGKIIAISGAAQKIAQTMMRCVGQKHIQWAMVIVGFIVGIPLFYGVGFVLMVPLIFSIVYQYKLPAVYIGLPMLASLSVTHGFLPPHPSPSALVVQFHADMGMTLIYGFILAVPAIIIAGPLFSQFLKRIPSQPLQTFVAEHMPEEQLPSAFNSFFTALLPVLLLVVTTLLQHSSIGGPTFHRFSTFLGAPSIVLMLAFFYAVVSLGIRKRQDMNILMTHCGQAIKDVATVILVIAGSGALKEVFTATGVSEDIAASLGALPIPPLALGWLIAAVIRICIGSATVAGLTAGAMILPFISSTGTDPNLMVLAVGAGSLAFSHVNDSGFWLFKEYFNLSIKNTILTWSIMESLVSIVGLIGVLLLDLVV